MAESWCRILETGLEPRFNSMVPALTGTTNLFEANQEGDPGKAGTQEIRSEILSFVSDPTKRRIEHAEPPSHTQPQPHAGRRGVGRGRSFLHKSDT